MDIKAKLITVTPKIAAEMLQKNGHNRPISDIVVKRYAQAMKDGKWMFNGESVIRDRNSISSTASTVCPQSCRLVYLKR